jgi:hypothetical protein
MTLKSGPDPNRYRGGRQPGTRNVRTVAARAMATASLEQVLQLPDAFRGGWLEWVRCALADPTTTVTRRDWAAEVLCRYDVATRAHENGRESGPTALDRLIEQASGDQLKSLLSLIEAQRGPPQIEGRALDGEPEA